MMPRYSVDVKAFFSFEVDAADEQSARRAADEFVETALSATTDTVLGYNQAGDDDMPQIVPSEIVAAIDGETEVEEVDG